MSMAELAHEVAKVEYICLSIIGVSVVILILTIMSCIFDYIDKRKIRYDRGRIKSAIG